MKIKKFALLLCLALCACCLPANASSLGDIRVNARFLTDRMAFELNLNQSQYNDLFEINFDFLSGVDPYLTGMACADAAALDAYYRYLDERNDDLRWILSSSAYTRFLAIEYFFRPIYAMNNVCYLRVYKVYPNRSFFYFGRPVHYLMSLLNLYHIRDASVSFEYSLPEKAYRLADERSRQYYKTKPELRTYLQKLGARI